MTMEQSAREQELMEIMKNVRKELQEIRKRGSLQEGLVGKCFKREEVFSQKTKFTEYLKVLSKSATENNVNVFFFAISEGGVAGNVTSITRNMPVPFYELKEFDEISEAEFIVKFNEVVKEIWRSI